jgi:hypothetical protein
MTAASSAAAVSVVADVVAVGSISAAFPLATRVVETVSALQLDFQLSSLLLPGDDIILDILEARLACTEWGDCESNDSSVMNAPCLGDKPEATLEGCSCECASRIPHLDADRARLLWGAAPGSNFPPDLAPLSLDSSFGDRGISIIHVKDSNAGDRIRIIVRIGEAQMPREISRVQAIPSIRIRMELAGFGLSAAAAVTGAPGATDEILRIRRAGAPVDHFVGEKNFNLLCDKALGCIPGQGVPLPFRFHPAVPPHGHPGIETFLRAESVSFIGPAVDPNYFGVTQQGVSVSMEFSFVYRLGEVADGIMLEVRRR